MARICPLCSGSSGNSIYISTSSGSVLIDAGISCKSLMESIVAAGGSVEQLRAVAVTHEHIDHVKGLKTFLRKTHLPIIASQKTIEALIRDDRLPEGADVIPVESEMIDIGGFGISRFATSHDCEGSSGYVVTFPDTRRVAVCTDLGVVDDTVRNALNGCCATVIESNHDVELLRRGVYPPQLKMRILSDKGHLSNSACAAELSGLLQSGTTRFILGHLSMQNNTPDLAIACAKSMLSLVGAQQNRDYILSVAKPCVSEAVVI